MARDISELMRHWMRQSELGRGIRLEASDLDLLNSIGFAEQLAFEAAKAAKVKAHERMKARADVSKPVVGTTSFSYQNVDPVKTAAIATRRAGRAKFKDIE